MNIYDIAAIAGVSPSTVSRAMNDKPGVGKKKKELILKILRENNYVPDENARMLVTQNSHLVGLITDDLSSKHQNACLAQSQNELIQNGYQCIARYMGTDMEKALAELSIRKVEGAMLIGLSFTDHEKLRGLIEKWLPNVPVLLVYQNEHLNMDNVYCIGANEKKGFRYCVDRLYDCGRRNMVLVIDKGRASHTKIQQHFESAAQYYDDVRYKTYAEVDFKPDEVRGVVDKILTEMPEVDGILCVQDRLAIEIMYELQRRGKRIPKDISVIGEGNSELCEVCRPRLTSMDTMVQVSTRMSVRLLVDLLEGHQQTHKITLDMELVERESL